MEVTCATSFDERFDPNDVLHQAPNKFWLTTGMYPQELTITFNQARVINEVSFLTSGVKKVQIQGCQTVNGNNFSVIGESKELQGGRGQMQQQESIRIPKPSSYIMLKFVILEGWEDFASVHNLEIQ